MKKKIPLGAVELVRKIRDRHARETVGRSVEEKLAYYRSKASTLDRRHATRGA